MVSLILLTHLSQNYPMIKLPCLSNELSHSGSCFGDLSKIILADPTTFEVHNVGWKLWLEPSGMEFLEAKTPCHLQRLWAI